MVPSPFEKGGGDDHGDSDAMSLIHIAAEGTRINHSGNHTENGKDCLAGTVVNSSSMREQDEIRREVLFPKCPILTAKYPTKISTWNVRTMFQAKKLQQVVREMKKYEIAILGLSEMRWSGCGCVQSEVVTILWSGYKQPAVNGVGLMINKEAEKALMEWKPVDEPLLMAQFQTKQARLTIIQVYAIADAADLDIKENFYDQ